MGLIVKNTTAADILHINSGLSFHLLSSVTLSSVDRLNFIDAQTFSLIGNGSFVINNGTSDIVDVALAWAFVTGDQPKVVTVQSIPAFASKTIGSKSLFKRVVGLQPSLSIGANTVLWACNFPWVKFMAVEITNGEAGDTISLYVLDSVNGQLTTVPNYQLNQFGFNANVAKDFYVHKSEFDADLYQNLQVKMAYTSVSTKNIGVNLVMNEVK